MKRVWTYIGNVLAASAVLSRAATAMGFVDPKPIDEDVWIQVRREIEQDQRDLLPDPDFGAPLVSALAAGADLRETILISYRTMPASEWPKLDAFWQGQEVIQTSAAGIQALVDVRSSLTGTHAVAPGALYENWILRAHHKPDHYDNGGGND